MHCTNCAAEVPEQRKFCGQCGAAVVRRCAACGAANPAQTSFAATAEPNCARILPRWSDGTDSRPIERRQLTVLFCDLVGSTALSARLDPEDFSAIIAGYRRCITETVAGFDGFVARHHGDGAVIYFGYPHAHEDDAERAVQASLALVQAVAALAHEEKLSARIGVATGVALVGDMSDSAISEEHGILGDTPNLAARLQSLAQPGGVIISGRTKSIAGPQFEYLDLGKVEINGFAKPVAAWQVAGKTAVTSRSHALQSSDLLPLIGRDEEMELLLRRWERARSGEGQVVLLSGEAGIGKSRLTVALLEQLAREPHIRLRCFCSPQHTDSMLYPVIGEMLRAARFAHDDSQQVKMDKLDALLAQSSTPPRMRRCLPKCCRCPTMDATLRLKLSRSSVVRKR
jgi:class 3 adenylate cyclase